MLYWDNTVKEGAVRLGKESICSAEEKASVGKCRKIKYPTYTC